MMKWTSKYEGKKIVLLGFGREGQSTCDFFKKNVKNCKLQIMDSNVDYVNQVLGDAIEQDEIKVYSKDAYLKFDCDVDLVFKSPGIPLKQIENSIEANKITSQSNEFIEHYGDRVVGITGTKGKSTTASFITALLEAAGDNVALVGNIGKPAFDYIDLKADEEACTPTYIYELSSHQLETVTASPRIAVVLNLFEEHLDHYHSYDHYAEAKMNIGRYQKDEDVFIYSNMGDEISKRLKGFQSHRFPINDVSSCPTDEEEENQLSNGIFVRGNSLTVKYGTKVFELPNGMERELEGHHNLINMAVGLLIYCVLGHSDYTVFKEVLRSFKGLPHRLSKVAVKKGVTYFNDSISTIPQATIAAIEAIPETQTIIVGGMDRGIDYSSLLEFLSKNRGLQCVLLPDTGHKLYEAIENKKRLYRVETIEEAVITASKITAKGRVCLLSPAAPSYGFFKNFEDRGNQFESYVKGLNS